MKTKIKIELGEIQKTLFMPVWARAAETRKKKPVLTDFTAVEIMDSVDFDFTPMTNNLKEINQIAWVARCIRFDRVVSNFIHDHPQGTIVNIGCGLDTTWERLAVKPGMWYDLDLPDVIELKRKFTQETGNRKFIPGSFLDSEWFDNVVINDGILFIAMGVFVYFAEAEVRDFITMIAGRFANSEMFFDVTSPKGVEIANQVISKSGLDSVSFFKWGLTDKSVITSWDRRIRLVNTYHTFRIEGLDMSEENKKIALISDSLDIQYMVHLSIEGRRNICHEA
ncbi:MAG TPA: class I SAM-dependent methyltransferase [Bacteroidales bacterium]|nr:class I SAM-dependent methyltransferase [Bacteroidales bacterium]